MKIRHCMEHMLSNPFPEREGDIFIKNGETSTSIMENLSYLVGNNFTIEKNNISLNTSKNIFLNPSIVDKGGIVINGSDIYTENNLFQINNYNGKAA